VKTLMGNALLLSSLAGADPRGEIALAYARSNRAMALKFVDGVFSIRVGRNFKPVRQDKPGFRVRTETWLACLIIAHRL